MENGGRRILKRENTHTNLPQGAILVCITGRKRKKGTRESVFGVLHYIDNAAIATVYCYF